MQKKFLWAFISLLLASVLVSAGCAPAASEHELKELESRVQALQDSLDWTQQQLLAAENSLNQVRQQNSQLQSQVNQTLTECSSCIEIADELAYCEYGCTDLSFCDACDTYCGNCYDYYPVYYSSCKYPYSYYQDSCYYPHNYYQCDKYSCCDSCCCSVGHCQQCCPPSLGPPPPHKPPLPPPSGPMPPPGGPPLPPPGDDPPPPSPDGHWPPPGDPPPPPPVHEPLNVTGNITEEEPLVQNEQMDPMPGDIQLSMAVTEPPTSEQKGHKSMAGMADQKNLPPDSPIITIQVTENLAKPPIILKSTPGAAPPQTTITAMTSNTASTNSEETQIAEINPPVRKPARNLNANQSGNNKVNATVRGNTTQSARKPIITPDTQIVMSQVVPPPALPKIKQRPSLENKQIIGTTQFPESEDELSLQKLKKQKTIQDGTVTEDDEEEEEELFK